MNATCAGQVSPSAGPAAAAHVELLQRSQAPDLARNLHQAVAVELHGANASATRAEVAAAHVEPRQLRHAQHARRHRRKRIVPELAQTSTTKKKGERGRADPHPQARQARQLVDVGRQADQLPVVQLRRRVSDEARPRRRRKLQTAPSRAMQLAFAPRCRLLSSTRERDASTLAEPAETLQKSARLHG